MFKKICLYCTPHQSFKSSEALEYHIWRDHPGQSYVEKSYYFPLFNSISIVALFLIVQLLWGDYLTSYPELNIPFIIAASILPFYQSNKDRKGFRNDFTCPECQSMLFPRISKDRKEYLVCPNDICRFKDGGIDFKGKLVYKLEKTN